jgi:hypothetical protein
MKMNKLFIILLAFHFSFSQQKTTGKLSAISKSGLHKISIPTKIRSISKSDCSDIRIYDSKSNEIPYYFYEENNSYLSRFEEFKIISKTAIPQDNTIIVVENPHKIYQSIVLSIANSTVEKKFSLSGSNDLKQWFGLINNQLLNAISDNKSTSAYKKIEFPISSYKYLKINFNDKKTLPINVLKVGNFIDSNTQSIPKFDTIKCNITTTTKNKNTQLHFVFQQPETINQIEFSISNPSFYKRNAVLFINTILKKKNRTRTIQEDLLPFELDSRIKNTFELPYFHGKDFYIEIENQDNLPLTFSKIICLQKPSTIVADLKLDEKYTIIAGNKDLKFPEYDLANFKDDATKALPEVYIQEIKSINPKALDSKEPLFWQTPWFMWICISIGIIGIAIFSIRLVKDMKV